MSRPEWVRLTRDQGDPVWVRPDEVASVSAKSDGGSVVFFAGGSGSVHVIEDADAVQAMFEGVTA